MTKKYTPIIQKINEASARLDVIADILSCETDPKLRGNYAREKGRIKSRITTYQGALKFAPRYKAA